MADPNSNSALSSPYPISNPPGPPGPDVSAPAGFQHGFGGYSHPYDPPPYRHPHVVHPNQYYGSTLSETYQGVTSPVHYHHFQHQNPQYRPWPLTPGHRADVYSYGQVPQFSGPARNLQTPSNSHPEMSDGRNDGDMLPMIEPFMPSVPPYMRDYAYAPPPQMPNYPYLGRRMGYNNPTPPVPQARRETLATPNAGRGVSMGVNSNSNPTEQPRALASPPRRPSYDRQNQDQSSNGAERRSANYVGPHSRRSDRSVSPRTSHRRSFDRYSSDSPGSPDAAEALTRARVLQRRRVRERAMTARHSHMYADSNTPTSHQMQILKDKLRHLLPSQLPEDSSTCCDICQKDYSDKYCDPTEEDEVAIQLPCKHVFGEHCINTWFETCKAHKNKITCPMCRKLLVEPTPRNLASVASVMPEMLAFFSRPGSGIAGIGHVEQQAIAHLMRARELEGDF